MPIPGAIEDYGGFPVPDELSGFVFDSVLVGKEMKIVVDSSGWAGAHQWLNPGSGSLSFCAARSSFDDDDERSTALLERPLHGPEDLFGPGEVFFAQPGRFYGGSSPPRIPN